MNTLSRQTAIAVARFQIILGLLLFLPAGGLDFWQGWVFWALFAIATASSTAYFLRHDPRLIERRKRAGPLAEQRQSQKRIMVAAMAFSLALMVVPGLDHRWLWSNVSVPLVLLSDVAVALGYLIVFLTLKENSFAASTVTVEADQRVISTGLYAQIRHPMYTGGSAMILATPLALGSYWGLLPAAALVATIVVRLLDEERFLLTDLNGYDAYCARVRYRLLPGIW